MALNPYLLLVLAVLVVATGLLAWIVWLLYTWDERHQERQYERAVYSGDFLAQPLWARPTPPPDPPTVSPPPRTGIPPDPPSGLGATSEAARPAPSPKPPPAPRTAPAPRATQPPNALFYEYTATGLVPVDPEHATPHPRTPSPEEAPAPEPEPASGDTDGRVHPDDLSREEDGFVWL